MIIAPNKADHFCAQPSKGCGLFLVFGPDSSLVQQRFASLRKVSAVAMDNQMTLSQEDLKSDPKVLSFHANSQSLFAQKRLFLLRDFREADLVKAVTALLEAGFDAQQTWFLIEGGDLAKSSKLRKLCEQHSSCAAIACYEQDSAQLMPLVLDEAKSWGFAIDQKNAALMIDYCANQRAQILNCFEKLALYYAKERKLTSQEQGEITALDFASLDAQLLSLIFGRNSDDNGQQLIDFALAGQLPQFMTALRSFPDQDEAWQALIWFALNQLTVLEDILLQARNQGSLKAAIDAQRPPIFWKRKTLIAQQIRAISKQGQRGNSQVLERLRHYRAQLIKVSEQVRGGGFALRSTLGQYFLCLALETSQKSAA